MFKGKSQRRTSADAVLIFWQNAAFFIWWCVFVLRDKRLWFILENFKKLLFEWHCKNRLGLIHIHPMFIVFALTVQCKKKKWNWGFTKWNSTNSYKFIFFFFVAHSISVAGKLFTTAGRKRVVIFVAGRTHSSSKGISNIHPYHFYSSGGLADRTRFAREPHAARGP